MEIARPKTKEGPRKHPFAMLVMVPSLLSIGHVVDGKTLRLVFGCTAPFLLVVPVIIGSPGHRDCSDEL